MEKKLPKNWVEINLKESVDFRKGKKPAILSENHFEDSVPYMDIQGLEKDIVSFYADKKSAKYFKENDVVIVWDGSRSGLILKPKSGAIGSTLGAMSPLGYKSEYLFYFLLTHYETINSKARGVGIPHVDPTYLWNLNVPLPPLPEQERIVAKLDLLFTQHEKMKTSLEKIPQILKDFRQQILSQAVTGKLTEEWRKGKKLGEWQKLKINDFSSLVGDGLHGTPKYDENGEYYFINGNNLSDGKIVFKDSTRKVDEIEFKKHQKKLNENTVFLSINGTLGNTAFYDNEKIILGKSACYINVNPLVMNKYFLRLVLISPIFMNYAEENATGTTIKNLGLKAIRNYQVNFPMLEEQTQIVSRVESLFSKIDAIELRYQKLKEKIDQLPQTILHKAFKGELVPQLPTDGDAKDLLKEILALKKK